MDRWKTIRVTKDREKWSVIKTWPTHAFMGLNQNAELVRAEETGVYMIMN
jgi:hypothetical protein